jgi:hypothetical protein
MTLKRSMKSIMKIYMNMKTKMMMLAAVAGALSLVISGCGNKEEAVTTQPAQTQAAGAAPQDTVQKALATAQGQTEVVKEKTGEAAANLQAQTDAAKAKAQTNDADVKVQNLIEQAKKLIAEGRWTEALAILNALGSQQAAGQSLSASQQKLVDGLKEQVQKALAAKTANDAAGAAGNLLKK